jgi:hypothetical protein
MNAFRTLFGASAVIVGVFHFVLGEAFGHSSPYDRLGSENIRTSGLQLQSPSLWIRHQSS